MRIPGPSVSVQSLSATVEKDLRGHGVVNRSGNGVVDLYDDEELTQ